MRQMKRDGISGRGVQRGKPVGTPPIPLPLPRSDPSVPALWGYRGQQEPLCLPLMGSQSCQEMLMHSRQSSLMVPELPAVGFTGQGREEPSRFAACPGRWFSGNMGLAVHIHFRVMQAML